MTNDTSTLNGALQELGETMATNLTTKGVTASANDGLTTLAGKILQVPTGPTSGYSYINDGSTVQGLIIGSNVTCTTNGTYITITTNTSGEKYVRIPITLTGDWQFESTVAKLGTANYITFVIGSSTYWGAIIKSGSDYIFDMKIGGGTNSYNLGSTSLVGKTLKITYINGTLSVYWDNTLKESNTVTISNTTIGFFTNNARIQYLKDIELKSL